MPIRPAGPADATAVARLVERAFAPWVALVGRRPAPMDDDHAARIAAGQAWVLEEAGRVEGALILEDAPPGALLLDTVAVAPEAQGKGHGRALVAFAEGEARRRGRAEVRLYTNARMAPNVALYERLGYAVTDRRGEDGFDRVFMRKRVLP